MMANQSETEELGPIEIPINEPELNWIELIRAALSEETVPQRLAAIQNVKHDVVATRLEALLKDQPADAPQHIDLNLLKWIAQTESERHEAMYEFARVRERYERKNERRLNIAEEIGKRVWLSIKEGKFRGVQTDDGILAEVLRFGRETKVRGATHKDSLRETWKAYRGVVHLGIAIDYCSQSDRGDQHVLHIAETIRRDLSRNCPKGTSKPYVDEREQLSFVYVSMLWGPRNQNRGLPFYVI